MNEQIIVVIGDDPVVARQGEFEDDSGKTVKYDTRKQPAKIEANGYAYPGMIPLEKGQAPHAPGRYVMRTDKMFGCDNNGRYSFKKYPTLQAITKP